MPPPGSSRETNSLGQDLRYSYDSAGRAPVFEVTSTGQTSQYSYDAPGQRISERVTQNGALYWHQ